MIVFYGKRKNSTEKNSMEKVSEKTKENRDWDKKLYGAANLVIKIIGCILFAALSWYALRFTQYIYPSGDEITQIIYDSVKKNLLWLVAVIGLLVGVYYVSGKLKPLIQYRVKIAVVAIAMVWVGVRSVLWILGADRVPVGDQAFLYGAASYFRNGDFVFFGPGAYFGMYPYQLGLVAQYELIMLFAGAFNHVAIQLVSAVLAVGIVYLGYLIVSRMTESLTAILFYCVAMMCCVPLVFYTSWVYGDIPGIFFSMLAYVFLLKLEETGKKRWLTLFAAAVSMAVLVRQTTWIFVVAIVITGLVHVMRKRSKMLLIALALAIVMPKLAFFCINEVYEYRSGQEISDGIPQVAWIAMGLQESSYGYGWYNDYSRQVYGQAGFDLELTAELAKTEIRDRLAVMKENPSYGVVFFREKILSQWNQPLFQSIYFNTIFNEENKPSSDSYAYAVETWKFMSLFSLSDRLQFIVYVGMICYFAFCVKRDSNMLHQIPAVTIIGGFLFSIMWEAKARYSLPYYIMMFPLAAVGYRQMISAAAALYRKHKKPEVKDNIIEFKKIA